MLDSPFLIQERMLHAHVRSNFILREQLLREIGVLTARVRALT